MIRTEALSNYKEREIRTERKKERGKGEWNQKPWTRGGKGLYRKNFFLSNETVGKEVETAGKYINQPKKKKHDKVPSLDTKWKSLKEREHTEQCGEKN